MVKTRNQQKIAFPRRKPTTRSKYVETTKDLDTTNSTCCIAVATLARSCRDRVKGVDSAERKVALSPAKKKKIDKYDIFEDKEVKVKVDNYAPGSIDEASDVFQCRTRRSLSFNEENEPSQGKATQKQSVSKSPGRTRRALKVSSVSIDSPKKTSQDVFLHGVPAVLVSPAPLSCMKKGKRRHSSSSDKEQQSLPTRILKKPYDLEKRPHSTSFTPLAVPKGRCISENNSPNKQLLCVRPQDAQVYKEAKHVLHSAIPNNLLCRETETKEIISFFKHHLVNKKPGSLYISGAPGTGKTACLTNILGKMKQSGLDYQVQFINCMNMSQSHRIFSKITEELTGWDKLTNKEAQKFLEKKFTDKGNPIVLVLDEIDQLESKNQDVLYTMFEWPALPSSRLILIGIANALDLTDRVLPRLQLRVECKPKLLHFSPYSKDQIVKILTARLNEVEGSSIVDVSAVQFCARKIAAMSGDMRKALDICRRAVEVVESEVRRQKILKPIAMTPSPKKAVGKKVTIAHVSRVISEVYGSKMISSSGEQPTIPLQQKLLICTILLMQKETKLREIPVGQLHETYCGICKKRQVSQISQEDCLALCNLLETRGIITMKRAKETRMAKVSLKIDEKEVDHALQDKILLSSILQAGLGNK